MPNQSASQNKTKGRKIPVQASKLELHLVDQLSFLKKSIKEFDLGDTAEFRRMAVALRILLHDSRQSQALLTQVGLADTSFISYAPPLDDENLVNEFSLAMIEFRPDGDMRYAPVLDNGPVFPRKLSLAEWKAELVLRDSHWHKFTRWEIVSSVADQDGGAHVDPGLNEPYHRLANENSIGWVRETTHGEVPMENIEKIYMRHIAWEALISIDDAWNRVVGNRGCQCGSGRKSRYCCGKNGEA